MSTPETAVAPLTTKDAEALVQAARAAAEAAGVAAAISVLDAGGHPPAFRRDDRAVLIAGETSRSRTTEIPNHRVPEPPRPQNHRPAQRSTPTTRRRTP